MNNRLCGFQQIKIILKSFYENSIKVTSNSESNKKYSIKMIVIRAREMADLEVNSIDCSSKSPEFNSLQPQIGS